MTSSGSSATGPQKDIRVIVVTDGQRILGLGDLGANGMGIPIGKLALYTACAGIAPEQCLPVTLDVGTNNESCWTTCSTSGYPRRRIEGKAYFDLVEEFVTAVQERYPDALIQFEDFLTPNAYALLKRVPRACAVLQRRHPGHGSGRAGGRLRVDADHQGEFPDLRIMFLGAGSAATGIADLIAAALVGRGAEPRGGSPPPLVRRRERPGSEVAGRTSWSTTFRMPTITSR